MSIIAWITLGLLPGFLAGALADHFRETVRISCHQADSDLTAFNHDNRLTNIISGTSHITNRKSDEYLRW